MRLLGVSAGAADGSAEILLKAALMEAEAGGAEVALVRLDDLSIPTGPFWSDEANDCPWLWEQLMASNGVIWSAPIYSRTIPGKLHLVADRLFGPHADVGLIKLQLKRQESGQPLELPFTPDQRALSPRVAGFIAVGGALTDQWQTLALPLMQTLSFSMRNGVVDQVCVTGAGTPQSIVLDEAAIARARRLGANVAAQLGRAFDEVDYRGEPGLCPYCHMSVVDVRAAGTVECAACGAQGALEVRDGQVAVVFDDAGLARSVISETEKEAHSLEILDTARRHGALRERIDAEAAAYTAYDRRLTPGAVAARR
jgi:multimeric flavodoxin WrbA